MPAGRCPGATNARPTAHPTTPMSHVVPIQAAPEAPKAAKKAGEYDPSEAAVKKAEAQAW